MTQTYIFITFLSAALELLLIAIIIIFACVFAVKSMKNEQEAATEDELEYYKKENKELAEENEGLRKTLAHIDVAQEKVNTEPEQGK